MLERADLTHPAALPGEKGGWLYTLPGVVAAVGLYSVLHVGARLIASANLGEDDPLEAVRTQTLQLGYGPQPPLYDWVLWLIEQVTGPGALPFQLLKYGLLTATCAFIFASARRVMKGDAFWAFLSVEALALIYQISWRFHEGFTHAVGAMCAVAATLWAMLRLIERRRTVDYALFGAIGGAGLLTVLPFAVYLAALIVAAALQPASRRAIAQPAFLLSVAIALAIPAPWLIWLAGTSEGASAILPHMLIGSPGYAPAALKGVQRAFTEPILYLAPLIFLYPIFFPAWLGTVWRTARLTPHTGPRTDFEQLVLHLTLLNAGALPLGAVVFGIKSYPVHALMPLFLVTSVWLTAQARKAARNAGEVRRFVTMALGIAVFAFFARAANMYVQEPVCKICRWGIPYDGLAEAIKARGFAQGRLVVYDEDLAGNLRRFFPEARVVVAGPRRYVPPQTPPAPGDRTVLVWAAGKPLTAVAKDFTEVIPGLGPETVSNSETVRVPWRDHLWKPDGYRQSEWRLAILER